MTVLNIATYIAFLSIELDNMAEAIKDSDDANRAEIEELRAENEELLSVYQRCIAYNAELRAENEELSAENTELLAKYRGAIAWIDELRADISALKAEQHSYKDNSPEAENEELSATVDAFFKALSASLEAENKRNARRTTT